MSQVLGFLKRHQRKCEPELPSHLKARVGQVCKADTQADDGIWFLMNGCCCDWVPCSHGAVNSMAAGFSQNKQERGAEHCSLWATYSTLPCHCDGNAGDNLKEKGLSSS